MDQKEINLLLSRISEFNDMNKTHTVKKEFIKNELKVYKQALRHNITLDEIDLIAQKFPNENPTLRAYRNLNKRQFTKEVPAKIIQGVVNILSHIDFKVVSANVKFNKWLESDPFKFKNNTLGFFNWAISCFIPVSFIDPNSILVAYPAPGDTEFDVIGINPIIIPFNRRYIDPEFRFFIILEKGKKEFIYCDTEAFWRVTLGQNNTWELIYTHNIGELPFVYLPGNLSFDEITEKSFNESLLATGYEYLDESLVSFTTYQAVKTKMNSIMIRPGLECQTCRGEMSITNESNERIKCTGCGGTGVSKRPSDMDDFVVLPSDTIQGDGKVPVKPEYINPDTSVAEFHAKDYKELMAEAKKAYGIDALIDKAESGEAMKKRLVVFEDFLGYLLHLVFTTTLTKYVQIAHKMLEKDAANWVDFPKIIVPKRVEIKTPEILKEAFNTAIGAERIQAAIDYYDNKYTDDPVLKRAMRLVVENYPSSIEPATELETLVLLGTYTRQDIAKGRRALVIIKKILHEPGGLDKTDEKIISETETILNELIPDQLVQQEQFNNAGGV